MITVNLFTSGKYTQPLIETLKRAKNVKLVNIYNRLPDLPDFPDTPDLFLVADFGQIIPKKILEMPKHDSLCLHPSLLPKYRGASPVQSAIFNGEKETGVTIFLMDEKVDHGPIITQFKEKIRNNDTAESLYQRLFAAGAEALVTILPAYIEDRIEPREQNHIQATYTKILTRGDGFIPPRELRKALLPTIPDREPKKNKAVEIERKIRAFHPWPGTYTNVKLKMKNEKLTKRLKILKAHLEKQHETRNTKHEIKLVLDRVQLEGKKPVSWKQFREGYPETQLMETDEKRI